MLQKFVWFNDALLEDVYFIVEKKNKTAIRRKLICYTKSTTSFLALPFGQSESFFQTLEIFIQNQRYRIHWMNLIANISLWVLIDVRCFLSFKLINILQDWTLHSESFRFSNKIMKIVLRFSYRVRRRNRN